MTTSSVHTESSVREVHNHNLSDALSEVLLLFLHLDRHSKCTSDTDTVLLDMTLP